MRGRAWERGLPLSFPLLDLEDRVRVQPADLWAMDGAAIVEASTRYSPAAILVGQVETTGAGAWVASWRLREASGESQWVTRGLTAGAAAAGAMDAVADRLAVRYAVSASRAGDADVLVEVVGVVGRPHVTRCTRPMRPLRTSSHARRNRSSLRCWLPVWKTRP